MSKPSKESMLDKERTDFENHVREMEPNQIKESIVANGKLIQFFMEKKGETPQVLDMMQNVLQKELEHQKKKG